MPDNRSPGQHSPGGRAQIVKCLSGSEVAGLRPGPRTYAQAAPARTVSPGASDIL